MKNKILDLYAALCWNSFFKHKYAFQAKKAEEMILKLKSKYGQEIQLLEELNIKKAKKSDTLFVLGSSSSINDLSDEQWEKIKQSDSIGLNFWMLHQFVPTYYASETPQEKERCEVFFHNLMVRNEDYKDVIMIIKNSYNRYIELQKLPSDIRSNTYISRMIEIPYRKNKQLNKSLQMLTKTIKQNSQKGLSLKELYYSRASIVWALFFGYACGYKKIVFCGVDLNHTGYFFDKINENIASNTIQPPKIQHGKVHKTLDKQYGSVTVDEIVYAVDKIILKPNDVKLSVINKESALYPKIPLYQPENIND